MNNYQYVLGLDFGTDSVRALLVNSSNGEELASSTHYYSRWKQGKYCDPQNSQFRQHPLDYIEGMESTIKEIVEKVPNEIVSKIKGISIATTGSTPVAVDTTGTPLALLPEFSDNPNAMFILWKDHSANEVATEINALLEKWHVNYSKYSGGIYSSEWFWSKIIHTVRTDERVAEMAFSWVEHCDWMPALLIGKTNPIDIKRSRCGAGHKAMWHEAFGGLPSEDFIVKLEPKLVGLSTRLYEKTYTSDQAAGLISQEWAVKLNLPNDIVVSVGGLDAHYGAVGAGIRPNTLVKVMGTSTCDMIVVEDKVNSNKIIKGICGQVDGSILPNMLGMEAGQSAFGDLYQWFKNFLLSPLDSVGEDFLSKYVYESISDRILPYLNERASQLTLSIDDLVALDWINGRRTPDVDMSLKCVISNITLGTKPEHIFKALVEATAFGSKAIIDRFKSEGIDVNQILTTGGISKKSDFVMQTLTNVLNMEIKVVSSEQACALGAAMFAATAAGIYKDVTEAQNKMISGFSKVYYPQKEKVEIYKTLYNKYLKLSINQL
jgi:L-ribulokinase